MKRATILALTVLLAACATSDKSPLTITNTQGGIFERIYLADARGVTRLYEDLDSDIEKSNNNPTRTLDLRAHIIPVRFSAETPNLVPGQENLLSQIAGQLNQLREKVRTSNKANSARLGVQIRGPLAKTTPCNAAVALSQARGAQLVKALLNINSSLSDSLQHAGYLPAWCEGSAGVELGKDDAMFLVIPGAVPPKPSQ